MRALLGLTTGVCLLLGYWVYIAAQQRALVESLRKQQYNVAYETLAWPAGLRARLGQWLGPDYASSPIGLYGNDTSGNFHGDLGSVARLLSVKTLALDFTAVNDDDLIALRGMPRIDFLILNHTRVTDAGLEHLTGLPLVTLHLNGLALTDACVEHLERITTLRLLILPKGRISDAALQKLRVGLPACEIREET